MSEGQGSALLQVGLDLVFIERRLELVRSQNHDDIGTFHRVGYIGHFQASAFGFLDRARAFTQTDHNLNTGVLQVVGVRVTLGAIAQNGHFLALDDGKITIFVVINVHVHLLNSRPKAGND